MVAQKMKMLVSAIEEVVKLVIVVAEFLVVILMFMVMIALLVVEKEMIMVLLIMTKAVKMMHDITVLISISVVDILNHLLFDIFKQI